jgi:hypothetical protein
LVAVDVRPARSSRIPGRPGCGRCRTGPRATTGPRDEGQRIRGNGGRSPRQSKNKHDVGRSAVRHGNEQGSASSWGSATGCHLSKGRWLANTIDRPAGRHPRPRAGSRHASTSARGEPVPGPRSTPTLPAVVEGHLGAGRVSEPYAPFSGVVSRGPSRRTRAAGRWDRPGTPAVHGPRITRQRPVLRRER